MTNLRINKGRVREENVVAMSLLYPEHHVGVPRLDMEAQHEKKKKKKVSNLREENVMTMPMDGFNVFF